MLFVVEIGLFSIGIFILNGIGIGIGNGILFCGVLIRFFYIILLVFRFSVEI